MRLSRTSVALLLALGSLPACKRKAAEPAGSASAVASDAAPPVAAEPPRCAALVAGSVFTVGDVGTTTTSGDAGDDEPDLPFAVEMGYAVRHDDEFVVSALRAKGSATHAVIALVPLSGRGGKEVDLGRTHGDVEPPRLANRGAELVAVVPDSDATGSVLRVAALKPGSASVVTWGGQIAEGRDESKVFDVELGDARGIVVWDHLDKKREKSAVSVATFPHDAVATLSAPRQLSAAEEDAEGPQLAPRPGGFWLSWLSRPRKADAGKSAPASSAALPPSSSVDPPLVALERRSLLLAPLDANGSLVGKPTTVTAVGSQVLAYELVGVADGAALVAWRDDEAAPGAEGHTLHLAHVSAAGSVSRSALSDDSVGAGVASLLVDAAPAANSPPLWLVSGSVSDETALVSLDARGAPSDSLRSEPEVRSAEPLAVHGGRLLVGRPHGLSLELSILTCQRGRPPQPGADAAPE